VTGAVVALTVCFVDTRCPALDLRQLLSLQAVVARSPKNSSQNLCAIYPINSARNRAPKIQTPIGLKPASPSPFCTAEKIQRPLLQSPRLSGWSFLGHRRRVRALTPPEAASCQLRVSHVTHKNQVTRPRRLPTPSRESGRPSDAAVLNRRS
jgi:hypothetical protein